MTKYSRENSFKYLEIIKPNLKRKLTKKYFLGLKLGFYYCCQFREKIPGNFFPGILISGIGDSRKLYPGKSISRTRNFLSTEIGKFLSRDENFRFGKLIFQEFPIPELFFPGFWFRESGIPEIFYPGNRFPGINSTTFYENLPHLPKSRSE